MKNKVFIIGLLMMFFSISTFAQQKTAKISFVKDIYQFGTIKAEAGAVECTFEFTNIGGEPLTIVSVVGDYGLLPLDWPKEAIAPGGKGVIKAKLDPQRNSGRFNKKITVTSNSEQPKTILRATGNIIPKPKSIADQYRQQMGNGKLRLKKNFFSMGKIKNTQIKTDSTEVINNGTELLTIGFKNLPKYVTAKSVPAELKPQQKGMIYITYDASKNVDAQGKQIWGAQNRRINVVLNNNEQERNNYITVRCTIEEDFSTWTEKQLANAPSIKFDIIDYKFDSIKQGETVKYDYKFTNVGKTDLEIRKVKGS